MSSPRRRAGRATRLAACGVVAAGVLAACGGSHHSAARTPPAPTTTSAPTTSVPRRHPIVDPLTGLRITRAESRHVAVVVKVDNIAQALPQSEIHEADVVYEEMVEGGLTRLAPVFFAHYPAVVGPVRSGRLTDEGIADDLHHPILTYAGANPLFQPMLAAQPLSVVDADNHPTLFVRRGTNAPHNLYVTVAGVAATVTHPTPPPALWAFRRPGRAFTGADVTPASAVSIAFPAAAITWTWSAKSRTWLRTQDGVADVDAQHVRLAAANVIVQLLPYVTSAYVSGEGASAQGDPIPTGEMVGSGTAYFFSGGREVRGRWHRSSLTSRTSYTDAAGHPVRLAPGQTWVELPPIGSSVTVTK